ncbi:MAG: septum formation initiator family protein [FCB group bacterium]|nr:septum formation initiator family protein [FCB group bacterium]
MDVSGLRKKVTRGLISRLAEQEKGFRAATKKVVVYLAVFYLVYLFCAGDYGLFRIHRLANQRDDLQAHYLATVAEAVDYSYRLRRLKTDAHYFEWLARTRYGFSRPHETIYHLR